MTRAPHLRDSAEVDRSSLRLRVDLLGPLTLAVDGRVVDVPGTRRRALLALLALAGGRYVGTARLIDSLWPEDPPDNAVQALYNHVSRLRRHLGSQAHRLQRHPNGYRLDLEPGELDVDAARLLAAEDPAAALALWRGSPLEEFAALPAVQAETLALAELWLQATETLLERRLERGEQVVAEAGAAAAASPFGERIAGIHVRALAAEGRTAEAMEQAHAYRRRLADETGLDPSPAFAELEQQVAAGSLGGAPAVGRVTRPDEPMVGRSQDREEVGRLLTDHAIVTLTGPGGVGKTRLAWEIAADNEESAAVSLAVVGREDHVHQAVASALGLRMTGPTSPRDVAAALAARSMLLVLDNCEHVVPACRELLEALRRDAPGVRVLATSRVSLQVPGEYVVRLQPLPVPRDTTDWPSLRRQPAVRAFVEHARRRDPAYEPRPEDSADLVEVLRRLDGLPLGIELAARQVSLMPVHAIRTRLDRALDLGTGRHGRGDARQRTLRATIESSYRLLGADEQWLLREVAPFVGGVDIGTVEVLAAQLSDDPVELLHRLVDASLLSADAGQARYHLLYTVRAFLLDEAADAGEADAVQARFVARCRATAQEIGQQMLGPEEQQVDRRLRDELDNLRAARVSGTLDDRVDITLAVNRVTVWRDLREPWEWAVELADAPGTADHPRRADILAAAADARRLSGELDPAVRTAREAIALGEDVRAWSVLAVVAHFRGDFAAAREGWLRAATAPSVDEAAYVASAALAAAYDGETDVAGELLRRARASARCGSHHAFVDYVHAELQPPEQAIPWYESAIAQAASVGCTFVEGVARVSLASAQAKTGDLVAAARGLSHLIELWRRTGQATQLWTTVRNAADVLASAGHQRTAVLLLLAADQAPSAAAVDETIARRSARAYVDLTALVGARELHQLRDEAAASGTSAILDIAVQHLAEVVAAGGADA